jgi:hypothetical protein
MIPLLQLEFITIPEFHIAELPFQVLELLTYEPKMPSFHIPLKDPFLKLSLEIYGL